MHMIKIIDNKNNTVSSLPLLVFNFTLLREIVSCCFCIILQLFYARLPCGSEGKAFARNAGDPGLIPGSGRFPGEGDSNPLQYSCLENSWAEEPGGLQSMESQRVGHDFIFTFILCTYTYMGV